MKASILKFVLLGIALSISGCSTERPYKPTDAPVSIEFLKGKWEGHENGRTKAFVTIGDEFNQIEFVDRPNSKTENRYQITTVGAESVMTIENIEEPLRLVVDANELRFDLSPEDNRKESVPTITMLRFRRT